VRAINWLLCPQRRYANPKFLITDITEKDVYKKFAVTGLNVFHGAVSLSIILYDDNYDCEHSQVTESGK
jgi:hypothetical protein